MEVNVNPCGPTVTNLLLLNKTKLRKYLLLCFFMERRWASLSLSPNKHKALTPAAVQRVTLSLFASRPCHSLCFSSLDSLEQLDKNYEHIFLVLPQSWHSSPSIHVKSLLQIRLDYRVKPEPPIHPYNNTYNIIRNIRVEFILLQEKWNRFSFFLF